MEIKRDDDLWISDHVHFKLPEGSESEKIYLEIKDRFPKSLPEYWLKRTANNLDYYFSRIRVKGLKYYSEEEYTKVKLICDKIELLNNKSGMYNKVLDELRFIISMLESHKRTAGLLEITSKKKDKPSRAKQTFPEDTLLLNTYLDIYYPYYKRKVQFIKDDFYNFMTEIFVYIGKIPNICSNIGKDVFQFAWKDGVKIFEKSTKVSDEDRFRCLYFDMDTAKCSRLKNDQALKRFCSRKSYEGEYTYNYIKDRLNVIIKKTSESPDYFAITDKNKSFILRILYDQLISD